VRRPVVRGEQTRRLFEPELGGPSLDEPARVRPLDGERLDGIDGCVGEREPGPAEPLGPAEDGVHQAARRS
jgi:hypothetical protein